MEFSVGEIFDRVKEIDDRVIKEYNLEQKLAKSEMKRIPSVGNSLFNICWLAVVPGTWLQPNAHTLNTNIEAKMNRSQEMSMTKYEF